MKIFFVTGTAFLLLALGFRACVKEKKTTEILGELVDFLCFVRCELQYRATDFETLLKIADRENFKYVRQNNTGFFIPELRDSKIRELFEVFTNHLGTTDRDGQLSLCDEYIEKFRNILNEHQKNEKSKIQINTALSIFGALCIVIFFI